MSDHTPTPWAVETPMGDETPWLVEAGKEPYEWRCIAMTCADEFTLEDAAANAAFIVKAVNNHAALVKSLDACRRALKNRDRTEKEEDVYELALRTLENATESLL